LRRSDRRFRVVALRKVGEACAGHVIASDGNRAFDHDGWTPQAELMAVTAAFEPADWETITVDDDIDSCRTGLAS
jgi:hypothetical protein